MKCILCDSFSLNIICKECQKKHLAPSIYRDKVGDVEVISFYDFDDIKDFIHSKYEKYGSSILKILAHNSFGVFHREFDYPNSAFLLPIDDNVINGYSHTSILAQAFKSRKNIVLNNKLRANNRVKYASNHLDFKINNPRDFSYHGKSGIDVILVDDVVTDGVTINEAKKVLSQHGVNVLFGLVLSYSKRG